MPLYDFPSERWFFDVLCNRDLLKLIVSYQHGRKWHEINDARWCVRHGHLGILKEKKGLGYRKHIFETAMSYNRLDILEWIWGGTGRVLSPTKIHSAVIYQSVKILRFFHSKGIKFTCQDLDAAVSYNHLEKALLILAILRKSNHDLLYSCGLADAREAFTFLLALGEKMTPDFYKKCIEERTASTIAPSGRFACWSIMDDQPLCTNAMWLVIQIKCLQDQAERIALKMCRSFDFDNIRDWRNEIQRIQSEITV